MIASDKENDSIAVTIAVYKPDATWNNATATPVGGYWMREFTADLNGTHRIYAVATDSCGATTSLLIGTVQATTPPVVPNTPPNINSISIPAYKVTEGQTVFITIVSDDTEMEHQQPLTCR